MSGNWSHLLRLIIRSSSARQAYHAGNERRHATQATHRRILIIYIFFINILCEQNNRKCLIGNVFLNMKINAFLAWTLYNMRAVSPILSFKFDLSKNTYIILIKLLIFSSIRVIFFRFIYFFFQLLPIKCVSFR